MLLPSSFACDASQRLQSALASPPASPPSLLAPAPTVSNIVAACRSLHALLAASPIAPAAPISPKTSSTRRLLPAAHISTAAPAPAPLKLQAPQRAAPHPTPPPTSSALTFPAHISTPAKADSTGSKRKRCLAESPIPRTPMPASKTIAPSNKRQRTDDDCAPRTPKRARTVPEVMPLGLAHSDFQSVWCNEPAAPFSPAASSVASSSCHSRSSSIVSDSESDSEYEDWDDEDDRMLVEVVLRKIQLSRAEWQECARSMGRNRSSVGRRWKNLMTGGDIGLTRMRPTQCL